MKDPAERLMVALDLPTADEALRMVDSLGNIVRWFKVGSQLFTACGPDIVIKIKGMGFKVFLDLKFHDIPTTVSLAGVSAAKLGVDMFNVHSMGGTRMMSKTVSGVSDFCADKGLKRPIIIAVTALTSMTGPDLNEIGIGGQAADAVKNLAGLAKNSGLDGVVASPEEVAMIKDACGEGFVVVTPGVRPVWAERDDQARAQTPFGAIRNGSDYLVVGRPILKAQHPADAAQRTLDEIAAAL
ncbi:MAG: orotidine-5'-phosphate decarboxylase [Nitrospinae bacterium]|nr:orotidine-5'-phosphate decarboxylase [Nitrospinota bacterium]